MTLAEIACCIEGYSNANSENGGKVVMSDAAILAYAEEFNSLTCLQKLDRAIEGTL